jgi:predicted signal transduction protein with EAL and GGDEF domain
MIVRSVLGLGKSLEIPVLAEGVETAQQLEFLSAEDCGEVQGFYFGRPASAEHIRKILAAGYAEVQLFTDELCVPDEAGKKITSIAEAKGRGRRPRPSAA